jgi:hypothetical protein
VILPGVFPFGEKIMTGYDKKKKEAAIRQKMDADLQDKLLLTGVERQIDLIHTQQKISSIVDLLAKNFELEESVRNGKKYYRMVKIPPNKQ